MRRDIERMLQMQRGVAVSEKEDLPHKEWRDLLKEVTQEWQVQYEKIREEVNGRKARSAQEIRESGGVKVTRAMESMELQRQKQEVVRDLRDRLRCIDDPECNLERNAQAVPVRFSSRGRLLARQKNGQDKDVLFSDLIADAEWGILYQLDKQSIPRGMQKRYVLEMARRDLRDLLDHQLATLYSSAKSVVNTRGKVETIIQSAESREQVIKNPNFMKGSFRGFLAEKIAYSFFLRSSYGREVNLRVEAGDVLQDVLDKIDLVLERANPRHRRGVRVEAEEKVDALGIQITLKKDLSRKKKGIRERKKRGIEDVDDIAILRLSSDMIVEAFQHWVRAGRPSGGPEQFLDPETQKAIFQKALQRVFSQEEIEQSWDKLHEGKIEIAKAA